MLNVKVMSLQARTWKNLHLPLFRKTSQTPQAEFRKDTPASPRQLKLK